MLEECKAPIRTPSASLEVMGLVERALERIATGVAASYGARARLDFRAVFNPTVNVPAEAEFAASVCAELVGAENVERNLPPIMASQQFVADRAGVEPGPVPVVGRGGLVALRQKLAE